MKKLRFHLKLVIFFFISLNFCNFLFAKSIEKFSDSKDISNYFSGIIAINDNQFQASYDYFKSLNNLEESHYSYSYYYLYSQITLSKFKDAVNYAKKLQIKKLDNFESNLITGVYYLEKNDLKQARIYFEKLKNFNKPDTVQNLLSVTLKNWTNFDSINSAISKLKLMPSTFENIKKIQLIFAHCHFESEQTDEEFRKLTVNPNINYSRYNFFHANYLISKGQEKKAKNVLQSSLSLNPKNLILNQLQADLIKKQKNNNKFDCKKINHVIAEILYIVANGLSSQKNVTASNFYLTLAKYLNPNFLSYNTLYAENFESIEKNSEATRVYRTIKKIGSNYNWHASKRIASILKKQEKNEEAINYLKSAFLKIKNPTVYEIFDYAEFLKNSERFLESIKYYSKLISIIDKKHSIYGQVLDGRGIAYERTDQWNKAEIDLIDSLSISPDDAYVINYLAYSWIEKGINIEKSLEMLKKANRLRPEDGYITDSLGWALFKLKKYKESKKYLQLAVRLMPGDPTVNDHYGDVLWKNGNEIQARYYWNYVLNLEKAKEDTKKTIKKKLVQGL